MCPNINNKEVRNEFNRIIQAFGGEPMSIEEFKNKDLRNQRSGTDNLAMQIAYKVWDITNGEPNIPEISVVSYCRNIIKERSSEPEKMLPNVNGTNGALPVVPNIKLYEDLKLLNKDNLLKSVKYSEAVNWTQKLNMKKGYEDYRFEYRPDSRKNGYCHIVAIYNPKPSSIQQELDFGTSYSIFDRVSSGDKVTINNVNYTLRAVGILMSEKAKQVFDKGNKNNWSLDKILSELSIPKDQKQLLLDLGIKDREQLALGLASKYGYSVEVNTSKEMQRESYIVPDQFDNGFELNGDSYNRAVDVEDDFFARYYKNGNEIGYDEYKDALNLKRKRYSETKETPTQHYSNLTVPGGTNYTENEISTPLITPSIKGHAQFATDKGIGWFRSDENSSNIKERRILELQSDLFQKGRDKKELVRNEENILHEEYPESSDEMKELERQGYVENGRLPSGRPRFTKAIDTTNKTNENTFLQLLNKDNNWVTFFIKSIIQDSAKKGYEKVLFPKGETAAKIEGHETIADEIRKVDNEIEKTKNSIENSEDTILSAQSRIDSNKYKIRILEKKSLEKKRINEDYFPSNVEIKEIEDLKSDIAFDNAIILETNNLHERLLSLEEQKVNLKSQGIEKLKPIEAFYEIKVGNILEKQFGKDNVKTITDEYGNQWREIDINTIKESGVNIENISLSKGINSISKGLSKSEIKAIASIASDIEKRFGIKFNISDKTVEAIAGNKSAAISNAYYSNGNGVFFYHSITPDLVIHEMFGHPLLNALKYTNNPLYDELYEIASKDLDLVSEVENLGYTGQHKSDEIIIRAIQKEYIRRKNNKFLHAIERMYSILCDSIRLIFGKNSIPSTIGFNSRIKDVLDYLLYGKGSFNLFDIESKEKLSMNIDSMIAELDKARSVGFISKKIYDIFKNDTNKQRLLDSLLSSVSSSYMSNDNAIYHGSMRETTISADQKSISIYNPKTEKRVLFESIDGVFSSKDSLTEGDLMAFIMSLKNINSDIIKFSLSSEKRNAFILNSLPKMVYSFDGNIFSYNNIIHNSAMPGADLDVAFSLLPVDRIHVDSIISSNMSSSIQKISDGLKSQLHSAERSKNRSQVYIDSMKALIKDIEKYDDIVAMIKFVDFANVESEDVLRSVYKMAEQANSGDHIDRELLLDVNRNFISLYDTTISTIESLTTKAFGISDDFPKMDFKKFMVKLRNVRRNIDNIKSAVDIINKYEYINTIKEEGMSRGSTTVSSLTSLNQQDENNLFVECEDSSILSMLLGTMIMSKKEQHRILFSIVNDVKHRVNKRMETDGVLANLHSKWASVRKSRPLANFNSYHELDENGRSTGYLISNVKYGKFQKSYTEFIEKLNAKYNVSGFGSLPVDDAMASEYIKEKNKWMASNVDRMFTNEYYKLREEISPSTQEMLDEIEYNIRGFYAKFKDENGVIRTERMSANDKDDLFNMKKAKEALGMLTFSDGTPKEVGSYEYNMAIEIQNFNKKLRGKLKYKPDYASFEAARNHAEKTLSTEEYKVWLNENSYTRFKDEFYEKLDKLNKADQSENWNRLYQIRKDLLRYNRDINSFEVSGSRIESKKDIAESIKKIDVYLSANRKKALKSSVSFKDIAEMVPTKEYLETIDRLSEDKSPEGVSKLNSFKKNSGYYNEYGTFTLYSYWTKLEPKDKSMIETVPNFIWQEIDEDSEFYNKNYDKSLEKYGMQPNKTLYDNSSEYNKVVSTEADKEFLNAFVEAMKIANENYYYMMRSNPYRLPQISGGFLHKIRMGDNFLSGLSKAIKDELQYTPEDLFVGDSESSGRFYADGTPVKHVPTRYRSMLEDTNMISRDLLGTFASYYKASINFIEMNKEVPKIEVILNGLKNTEIRPKRGSDEELKNNKGVVKGGRSYQKAAEFVNEEVYGSSVINNYEFTLSRSSLTTSIENFIRKLFGKDRVASGKIGKVSMSKLVLNRLVPYTRLVNLFMNPQAIFSNLGGASVQQKIEASLGSFFTSEGLFKAKKEILLNMPSIMASSTNRSSDLITSIMRYYGVSRSNESDMKNLHGWKLGRFIKNNIWYGPYSAGDFAVKSPMVLAVLMNYKLYRPNENSEYRFYNREQFLSQFFPGEKRSDGVTVFDSIPDTLFSAYKMDGDLLTIKPEYSDFVDDKLEGSVSMLMQSMSRKLDGSLTGTERTQMHKDMIGAMLLLHKNYLLWAIQDRFHPKMFRYDLGIETSGIYKWNNVRKIPQVWLNMIIGKYGKANLDSKFEYSQVYAGRKLAKEMSWFVAITIAIALYGRLFIGDDDDKIKVSPEMFFNLLFTRTALEIASLWSPMEVYNLQKEPFGAIGTINELKDIFNMISSGTYNDVVRGGYYDGKTKLERSIYKSIPGVKQYYPYIGNPNYKRQDAFINSNLPSTYGLIRDAVWPDNWNKKAREKSEELYNRRIERENRLKGMGVDIEMLNKRKSDMEQKRDSLKELYGY